MGIGLLVGALAVGSGLPHLLNVFGGVEDWRLVLMMAAGTAALGGLIGLLFIDEGPHKVPGPRFSWFHVGAIVRDRSVVLTNLGYLGHMWELYAMWRWIPVFLLSSFALTGIARILGERHHTAPASRHPPPLTAGQVDDPALIGCCEPSPGSPWLHLSWWILAIAC